MPAVEAQSAVERAEELLEQYGARQESLIHILQDVQESFDYLPRAALEQVAEGLRLPMAEVLRVATFYAAFSLEPLGEHLVTVCMGTACHVRGAPGVLQRLEQLLSVSAGRTTDDGKFTLRTVNCLGACALGPLIAIDGKYYGNMTPARVGSVLENYRDDDGAAED